MKKPGYKHTAVGWIPEDWEVDHIGSLIQKLTSGVSVNGEERPAGPNEYGVLKVSSVSYGFFNERENKTILSNELSRARQNPMAGTIIISRANTPELVGASAYVFKTYPHLFLSDKLWQLEIQNKTSDALWLSYLLSLKLIRDIIRDRATGSSKSMRNISQEAFYSINVPLPPLSEQRHIAAILFTWDNAIAKQQYLINALRARHYVLSKQLLSKRKRLIGFKEQWNQVQLGQVGKIPSKIPMTAQEVSNRHLLTVKLYAKGIEYNGREKPIISATGRPYYERNKGEILFGRQNIHNGGVGIVMDKFDGGICSNAISSFCVNSSVANNYFIFFLFSCPSFYKKIENFMGGTGQKEISERQLLDLRFPIPSIEEQTAIATVLSTSEKEIQTHRRRLEALKQQKKGLMQLLLTGKIRVAKP